jgi:hypothetical protein
MKKIAFTSLAISCSFIVLGALFKIQHWPGASILLVTGSSLFALVTIPCMTKLLYDKLGN